MTLFKNETFIGAGGGVLDFKIECDSLTEADWECIAYQAVKIVGPFGLVFGVPGGGFGLAKALLPYERGDSDIMLIVDDVWTTGHSMTNYVDRLVHNDDWKGFVAFSRAPWLPENVSCLFWLTHAISDVRVNNRDVRVNNPISRREPT